MSAPTLSEAADPIDAPDAPTAGRRRGRGRKVPEGPRATFGQLLPFIFEHKRTLVVVAVLSVLGAVATLAQPLLVGEVITRVQVGETLGSLVWAAHRARRGVVAHLGLPALPAAAHRHGRRLLEPSQADRPHPAPADQRVRRTTHGRPRLARRHRHDTALRGADPGPGRCRRQRADLRRRPRGDGDHRPDPARPDHRGDRRLGRGRGAAQRTDPHGVDRDSRRRSASSRRASSGPSARSAPCARRGRRTARSPRSRRSPRTPTTVGVRIAKVSALVVPIAGIALQMSLLVVLGVGGFRVASGAITVAALVTFIMFLFMLIAPLGSTFGAITSVNQALGALGRIQEVLDLPTEEQGDATIATLARGMPGRSRLPRHRHPPPAIEFRDVRFRYPENVVAAREAAAESEARAVLESAHLDATPVGAETPLSSRRTATCCAACPSPCRAARASHWSGRRGAGKSTMLALIERFYDPTGGAIVLDGARHPHAVARAAARAARLRRAGRPDPGRHDRRQPAARPRPRHRCRLRARAARREPGRGARAQSARHPGARSARAASCSRAASASASRSPARCWPPRRSCCWTSRRPHWTA